MPHINELAALESSLAWFTPVLQNGWVAFGGSHQPPQISKDPFGIVRLRGSIKSGTTVSGDTILSLPVGFRPGAVLPFLVYTSAGVGLIQIEQSIGDTQVVSLPTNALLALNGISWKAEK